MKYLFSLFLVSMVMSIGFLLYAVFSYQKVMSYWDEPFTQNGVWLHPSNNSVANTFKYKYFEGIYKYLGNSEDKSIIVLTANSSDLTLNLPKQIVNDSIYLLENINEDGFDAINTTKISKETLLKILSDGKTQYKINICLAQSMDNISSDDFEFICGIKVMKL